MNDFQQASEINRQDGRVHEGYRKAQALHKRQSMVDYYKLLGVSRSASTRQIKKAYRKKAQEWHPDKYKGDLGKDAVQKKMAQINLAYEVLGNDELRQKYDNGDDPNDPQQQQQQHSGFPGGFQGYTSLIQISWWVWRAWRRWRWFPRRWTVQLQIHVDVCRINLLLEVLGLPLSNRLLHLVVVNSISCHDAEQAVICERE
jgi:DnaJ domain